MVKDTSAHTMTDATFSYGFFFLKQCITQLHAKLKKLQLPDTNFIFVVSGREKIIKSALLRVSQNIKVRNSRVYEC